MEAGQGIVGDRFHVAKGATRTSLKKDGPHRAVTLIEAEAVEAAAGEMGAAVSPHEIRRNIVTRGVPLNHLVGREFTVGSVRLKGAMLCEPCMHMEELSGRPGIRKALVHRGGLNAELLSSGTIRVGDPVTWE